MKLKRQSKSSSKSNKLGKYLVVAALCLVAVVMGGKIISFVEKKTTKAANLADIVSYLGGSKGQTRTLILFSNNAEMRYGGGFIGSVGYLEAKSTGKVSVDPIHSVYYYDHRLPIDDSRLEGATPELVLMPKIYLRDSGVDLDWKSNARRAAKLFELESGKKVDNVVMLTPNVVRQLLGITGPIYLSDYKLTVTQDNFLSKVQLEVESGTDKQAGKDPKTILGVLANQLLLRLVESGNIAQADDYYRLAKSMIQQKQLAIYSKNGSMQPKLESLDMDGGLASAEGNYLMVAEANMGVNKSSPFIQQDVSQKVIVDSATGKARVELTIRRQHNGQYSLQYVDPHDGQTKWLVGDNGSFVKIAVPAGSKVMSSSQELSRPSYNESGRTVYTYFASIAPGQAHEFKISYSLPFRYDVSGDVVIKGMVEKPIGSFGQNIRQQVEFEGGEYNTKRGGLVQGVQQSDATYEAVFGRV